MLYLSRNWPLRTQSKVGTLCLAVAAGLVLAAQTLIAEQNEPIAPIPLSTNIDPKRITLGARLFSDVRLSRGKNSSCAACHPLDRGGVDGLSAARSPAGGPDLRNTLTVFNVGLSPTYNWDGVAKSLEQHTDLILANPRVMNLAWPDLLARVGGDPAYVSAFQSIYPHGLTRAAVLDAIASFERSLLTPNSRFDRYLMGEHNALSVREKEGYRLFKAYGCVSCHQGVNMGGNLFQKFGVFESTIPRQESLVDLGRFRITKMPRDREVFRVPSLRNVAVTGPYFHDGRERKLKGAVETMAKAQLGRKLKEDEIGQIVEYLKTLTGQYRGKALNGPSAGTE